MTVIVDHALLEPLQRAQKILAIPKLHRGTTLWDGLHVARTKRQRESVGQHRYQVYMNSRGADYPGLCHDRKMLTEPEDADAYLVYSVGPDENISSSLRIGLMSKEQIAQYAAISRFLTQRGVKEFRHGAVAFLARMCSSSQGGKDLLRLMMFGYFIGLCNNIEFAFLTTRPQFCGLYERLGYVRLDPAIRQDGVGTLSLFGASMTDYAGFCKAGSPYTRIIDIIRPRIRLKHLAETFAMASA